MCWIVSILLLLPFIFGEGGSGAFTFWMFCDLSLGFMGCSYSLLLFASVAKSVASCSATSDSLVPDTLLWTTV